MSSVYHVGIHWYPNDNPPRGPWSAQIPTIIVPTGIIDIDALMKLVDFFTGKCHPILIIFNYGTTFEGTYVDVMHLEKLKFLSSQRTTCMYSHKIYYDWRNTDQYSECTYAFYRDGLWQKFDQRETWSSIWFSTGLCLFNCYQWLQMGK